MSAPTSPSSRSPRSASDDAGLISGFDGEQDVLRAWTRGLTPDPHLTVSEWADRHRWLSSRASAEPGRYRTDRTPYMRDIMDALRAGSEPAIAVCPPVVEYSPEFQVRAADELALLPVESAIAEMLSDYTVVREQARACRSE